MASVFRAGPARFAAVVLVAFAVSAGCSAKSNGDGTVPPAGADPTVSADATLSPPADEAVGGGTGTGSGTGGSGTGSGSGSGSGSGGQTSSWPTPEDCISYNPNNVTVQYANGVYTVSDGSKVIMKLHGQDGDNTGQKGLALAQRYKRHCFIGNGNSREEKASYIFDYWRDPSGKTPTIPGQDDDCRNYKNSNLTVEDMGNNEGWRVKDHDDPLHLFDNGTDAKNGKLVLVKYNRICFIGDTNDDSQGQDHISYML